MAFRSSFALSVCPGQQRLFTAVRFLLSLYSHRETAKGRAEDHGYLQMVERADLVPAEEAVCGHRVEQGYT